VDHGAVFGLVTGLMAPRSRGWARLASTNPTDPPRIHPAHLTDDTVADASITPTIASGTTNLPTIMVAEHIARSLLS